MRAAPHLSVLLTCHSPVSRWSSEPEGSRPGRPERGGLRNLGVLTGRLMNSDDHVGASQQQRHHSGRAHGRGIRRVQRLLSELPTRRRRAKNAHSSAAARRTRVNEGDELPSEEYKSLVWRTTSPALVVCSGPVCGSRSLHALHSPLGSGIRDRIGRRPRLSRPARLGRGAAARRHRISEHPPGARLTWNRLSSA